MVRLYQKDLGQSHAINISEAVVHNGTARGTVKYHEN